MSDNAALFTMLMRSQPDAWLSFYDDGRKTVSLDMPDNASTAVALYADAAIEFTFCQRRQLRDAELAQVHGGAQEPDDTDSRR